MPIGIMHKANHRRQEIAACREIHKMSQSETAKFLGLHINTVKKADAIRKAKGDGK